MGMKEIATMLAGAAALMPDTLNAPRKRSYSKASSFTKKQWLARKKKLKQQRSSRRVNRKK